MGFLNLTSNISTSSTIVSNYFIDKFMPDANGEFVKIYLYLLRCVGYNDKSLSISQIADKFNHTEKDVNRALKYWEKVKLIHLDYNERKEIIGISILDLPAENTDQLQKATTIAETAITSETSSASTQSEPTMVANISAKTKQKPSYTADELKNFKSNTEIQQLLFIAEQYLEKTLSPNEINTILFFYSELKFPLDLIEYLIEYCVSKGSKSIHYIETVAIAWSQENIGTVNEAKESTNLYNKNCFSVFKAYGIKGRNPVDFEVDYIKKWIKEYAFTIEIVTEACKRTIQLVHQPSFEYTDSILTSWKNNGVKHLDDIKLLDEQYQQKKETKEKERVSSQAPKKATNKFNNFHQRSYNYEELEKQLLNSK